MSQTILVRGIGDVGSAVAHVLRAAGHHVAIHDQPSPHHGRRGMAFVDAVFDGTAVLEGTLAKRVPHAAAIGHMLACGKALPVTIEDLNAVLEAMRPDVLVDARMNKREPPEPQVGLAKLTIALGPGVEAGVTADIAVETAWGEALGRVLASGETQKLEGEPRVLGGLGRERFVYAPRAGSFTTDRRIGEWVEAGALVAMLGKEDLRAPVAGFLRGLTRGGVYVATGTKVIEIDPRTAEASIFGLGERPRRIAEGVLRAIGSAFIPR